MAPEQIRLQAVDHRADIFAFGCVLYEMLSGRRAFQGDGATDVAAAVGVATVAAPWSYDGRCGLTFAAGEPKDPACSLPIGLIAARSPAWLRSASSQAARVRPFTFGATAAAVHVPPPELLRHSSRARENGRRTATRRRS
jgi:serine/threonine protein kinase